MSRVVREASREESRHGSRAQSIQFNLKSSGDSKLILNICSVVRQSPSFCSLSLASQRRAVQEKELLSSEPGATLSPPLQPNLHSNAVETTFHWHCPFFRPGDDHSWRLDGAEV